MNHSLLRSALMLLALGAPSALWAQSQTLTNSDVRVYDSLTDLTQSGGGTETGTTDVTGDFALTARGAQKTTGAGAYVLPFAPSGRGSISTGDPVLANFQANTLSTTLVTDAVFLRAARNPNPFTGATNVSFSLNSFRFLLTNENTTAINLTANLRFYDDDGLVGGSGGFAGTLLKSAAQNVTLAANTGGMTDGTNATVTQLEFDFSAAPLLFASINEFVTETYVEKQFYVGFFLTADSGAVTAEQLGNVGSIVYDTDLSARNTSPFSSDAGPVRSSDFFYGDDGNSPVSNAPYDRNLYDYNPNTPGKNVDLVEPNTTGRFTVARTLNGTTGSSGTAPGPDANFAFFVQGDVTYVVPEPASIGFALVGFAPLALCLARRRRAA